MDAKLYSRLYHRITREGFISVSRPEGRQSCLMADGAVVAVKVVSRGKRGWRVTIHRHGIRDEAGLDAYLILLDDSPVNSHYIYLMFEAPLDRSDLWITPRNLLRRYRGNVEAWGLLKAIAEGKKKSPSPGLNWGEDFGSEIFPISVTR